MPNWCYNVIQIRSKSADQLDAFLKRMKWPEYAPYFLEQWDDGGAEETGYGADGKQLAAYETKYIQISENHIRFEFDTPWVPLLPAFNQICRMVQENKRYHGIDLRLDFADILWGAYCGYNEQLFDEPTGAFVKQDRWDEIQHGSSQFDVISPSYYHFPSDFGVYA